MRTLLITLLLSLTPFSRNKWHARTHTTTTISTTSTFLTHALSSPLAPPTSTKDSNQKYVPMLCSRAETIVPLTCRIHTWDLKSEPCISLRRATAAACGAKREATQMDIDYQQRFIVSFPVSAEYEMESEAAAARATTKDGASSTIPTHLHQTWKTRAVHPVFQRFYDSWSRYHPTWTRQIWSDEDNRNLVATEFPELLTFYDELPHFILKVDIVRYLILYARGGVYADMDVESLKSMDDLLVPGTRVLLGFELYDPEFIIEISIMGAVPGQSLFLKVVREAVIAEGIAAGDAAGGAAGDAAGDVSKDMHTVGADTVKSAAGNGNKPTKLSVYNITGNCVFTRVVRQELLGNSSSSSGIQVLAQNLFYPGYPLRYETRNEHRCRCGPVAPVIGYPCHACKKMYPDSYTIHHETGTWVYSWERR